MAQKKDIVIVTDEFDPHTDRMMLLLREEGHQPRRLHTADFPQQAALSQSFDGTHWSGRIRTRKHEIDVNDIRSIWWRRPALYTLPAGLSQDEHDFAQQELDHALSGLWGSLDCYWMSYPTHIRRASYKLEQLSRATQLGLEIPRTLITSEPEAVKTFYESCQGRIVYKALYGVPYCQDKNSSNKERTQPLRRTRIIDYNEQRLVFCNPKPGEAVHDCKNQSTPVSAFLR